MASAIRTARKVKGKKTVGKAVWGGKLRAVDRRREKMIEASPTLAPLARRGVEGPCFACGQSTHSHYGRKGVWVGCPAHGVPPKAMFALVPIVVTRGLKTLTGASVAARTQAADSKRVWNGVERRTAVKRGPGRPKGSKNRVGGAVPKAQPAKAGLPIGPRYVYMATDKRKALPETFSQAMQDAYSGLKAASKPVNATEAAKLAKRPQEANRRCLNILVLAGYVTRHDTNTPISA